MTDRRRLARPATAAQAGSWTRPLAKKSRSTVHSPIFSYSLANRASSAAAASEAPPVPLANSEPTPSITVFFQAGIWLAWTPYRLDNSATVQSSRTAANATFALKSTPCFLRSRRGTAVARDGDHQLQRTIVGCLGRCRLGRRADCSPTPLRSWRNERVPKLGGPDQPGPVGGGHLTGPLSPSGQTH